MTNEILFINTLPRSSDMSVLVKQAVGQTASMAFERMLHKRHYQETASSRKISAFLTLVQMEPKYVGNCCDFMIEKKLISEDDMEEVARYLCSGEIPYSFLTQKLIEDYKGTSFFFNGSTKPGMLMVYLAKVMGCSLIGYKKMYKAIKEEFGDDEEINEILDFLECRYYEIPERLKNDYFAHIHANTNKARMKFRENEVSLFTEVLVDMLKYPISMELVKEVSEVGSNSIFNNFWVSNDSLKGIPMSALDSSSVVEPEITDSSSERTAEPTAIKDMSFFPMDLLGWGPNGETPEECAKILNNVMLNGAEAPKEEDTKEVSTPAPEVKKPQEDDTPITNTPKGWQILKIAKDSSQRVMSKIRCSTETEAKDLLENWKKEYKEMFNNFDFKIEPLY